MPASTHEESSRINPPAHSDGGAQTISLVLAESYPLLLDGMSRAFDSDSGFRVLGTCDTAEQATRSVARHRPDVLILDLDIPGDAFAVLRGLMADRVTTRPVLLAAVVDEHVAVTATRLGVRGIVLKNMARELLVQCVRKVHRGGIWIEKVSMTKVVDQMLRHESGQRDAAAVLSARELEIARMVAAGWSNRDIGGRLNISAGTVKVHLHHVYEKLGVKGRLELALYARERALVSPVLGDTKPAR